MSEQFPPFLSLSVSRQKFPVLEFLRQTLGITELSKVQFPPHIFGMRLDTVDTRKTPWTEQQHDDELSSSRSPGSSLVPCEKVTMESSCPPPPPQDSLQATVPDTTTASASLQSSMQTRSTKTRTTTRAMTRSIETNTSRQSSRTTVSSDTHSTTRKRRRRQQQQQQQQQQEGEDSQQDPPQSLEPTQDTFLWTKPAISTTHNHDTPVQTRIAKRGHRCATAGTKAMNLRFAESVAVSAK